MSPPPQNGFQERKVHEVHFKSNAHAAKNQSNLFIQVNFHITSFDVVPSGFDDTFPEMRKFSDVIK